MARPQPEAVVSALIRPVHAQSVVHRKCRFQPLCVSYRRCPDSSGWTALPDPAAGADRRPRHRHRLAAGAAHLAAAGARAPDEPPPCHAAAAGHRGPQGHRRPGDRDCAPVRRAAGRTAAPEDAPATQMNLVLAGGVRGERSDQGPGHHRRIGASRQGVCGRRRRAPGHEAAFGLPRIASSSIATASSKRCRCRGRAPRASSAMHARAGPAPRRGSGQFADNLRRIAETNPTAFAEIVRPQPVFANGVQRGYRVYPGRNRQQFASSACSRATWCCRSTARRSTIRSAAWRSSTRSAPPTGSRVTVERNGQSQELTLNTAQIMLPDANRRRRAGPASRGRSRRPRSRPSRNSSRPARQESKDRP